MDYRFHILTTVQFRHTYFSDSRYRSFVVEPDAETMHHFKRLGILFKPLADGFTLLYETSPGRERQRIDILREPYQFGFIINNNDGDFFSYTDGLPADIASTVLFFRNDPSANPKGLLHRNNYFSGEETLQNKPPDTANPHDRVFFTKPFAWMQIALHEELEENLAVHFKGRETVWRYILGSEHLQDLTDPAVIHKDTKALFRGPLILDLPDGTRRTAFESVQPIPLSSKPEKVYQLVENYDRESGRYKVVMTVLPNPDIRTLSAIRDPEGRASEIFSEIFI